MNPLSELQDTRWEGTAELWLDPLGDEVAQSDCTIAIDDDVLRYTWSHAGKAHEGSLTLSDDGAVFLDSFHQNEPMVCRHLPDGSGLLQVQGEYGPESAWLWRTGLSLRTHTGELIMQMTNIAPWGEEARAVRMTCKRQQ